MGIWEIIVLGLAAIAVPSVVILIGHFLARERDRLKRFNNASEEFRKVFNQSLVDAQGGKYSFGTSMSTDIIKTHHVAYLNFRPHLQGICRNQYDKAWGQYCRDCENTGSIGIFARTTRVDLGKDIKCLLEFTEYGLLRSVYFYWHNLWFRFRLKIFGPGKKTKDLVEKFIKSYQDKDPP